MKLSEELRRCLDNNGCKKCTYYETKTTCVCSGLLQKAYEEIKKYEKEKAAVFHRKNNKELIVTMQFDDFMKMYRKMEEN